MSHWTPVRVFHKLHSQQTEEFAQGRVADEDGCSATVWYEQMEETWWDQCLDIVSQAYEISPTYLEGLVLEEAHQHERHLFLAWSKQ